MTTTDLLLLGFDDDFHEWISTEGPLSFGAVWFCVGVIWFIVTVILTSTGRPETKVAKGSFWWLIWISAVLAGIVNLPAVVFAVHVAFGTASTDQFWITFFAILFGIVFTGLYLQPPVRVNGSKQQLPRLTDDKLLSRIEELAQKMGVLVPVVRLLPSMGPQQTQAFAGTIQAPQLLLTDGILHRLEAAERDAIIGHELGHFANGSLWLYVSIFPVCCACTVAVAALFPWPLAIAFGFALFVGLKRSISRPLEFDCDLRAARAVGFRATASALSKIHAVHPIKGPGLLSQLVYATATHPSREARLVALLDAAPEDDRPDVVADSASARMSGQLAFAAGTIWLVIMTLSLMIGLVGKNTVQLVSPLLAIVFTPYLLVFVAIQKQSALFKQQVRVHSNWGWGWPLILGAGLFFVTLGGIYFLGATTMKEAIRLTINFFSLCAFLWFMWFILRDQKQRPLLQKVAVAIQLRNFQEALDLCTAQPKIVAKSHLLRYNQAICHEVCGDRATAIAVLEKLWADKPRFPLTALALAELLLDSNQPERAIELIRAVAPLLPNDPTVPLMEGRILRRWGKLDEAQAACDRTLVLAPDNGIAIALAAALELDRGHFDAARTLIQKALEFAPGEPYLLVVKAEIDLATESVAQGQLSVNRATELIQSNPFAFLQAEVARLNEILAAKRPDVTDDQPIEIASVDVAPQNE